MNQVLVGNLGKASIFQSSKVDFMTKFKIEATFNSQGINCTSQINHSAPAPRRMAKIMGLNLPNVPKCMSIHADFVWLHHCCSMLPVVDCCFHCRKDKLANPNINGNTNKKPKTENGYQHG
jgi:hypothetical protein